MLGGQSDLEADGGQLHDARDADGVDAVEGHAVGILREEVPVHHHLPRDVHMPGRGTPARWEHTWASGTPASRSLDLHLVFTFIPCRSGHQPSEVCQSQEHAWDPKGIQTLSLSGSSRCFFILLVVCLLQ